MPQPPYTLQYDEHLHVHRPILHTAYEELSMEDREAFERACQKICAHIPIQIERMEQIYMQRYAQLEDAQEDEGFFALLDEMNELSYRISALNVLFFQIEGRFLAGKSYA